MAPFHAGAQGPGTAAPPGGAPPLCRVGRGVLVQGREDLCPAPCSAPVLSPTSAPGLVEGANKRLHSLWFWATGKIWIFSCFAGLVVWCLVLRMGAWIPVGFTVVLSRVIFGGNKPGAEMSTLAASLLVANPRGRQRPWGAQPWGAAPGAGACPEPASFLPSRSTDRS